MTATERGHVEAIATRDIGLAVVMLGGGRVRSGDAIDHAVGLTGLLPLSAAVDQGDALAMVHARDDDAADRAVEAIRAAYTVGPRRNPLRDPVVRRTVPTY